MESQKLIERIDEHHVKIGPFYGRVKKYFELVQKADGTEDSLRRLADANSWAHWEEL
jgi:hypothetical protein